MHMICFIQVPTTSQLSKDLASQALAYTASWYVLRCSHVSLPFVWFPLRFCFFVVRYFFGNFSSNPLTLMSVKSRCTISVSEDCCCITVVKSLYACGASSLTLGCVSHTIPFITSSNSCCDMLVCAFVRDILRPAPWDDEFQLRRLPFPRVI